MRLYVQKGHNHHACHRFLKKRRMRRPVCVHPWTKGFPPLLLPRFSTTFFNHLLQAGEIRDSTTAGSQRLALSGLQSRLHTIRKYTFPPSSAEAAAAELVRLYAQKGHNHHACHRFLKKRRMRRPVCVHPWTKGFPPLLLPRFSTTFFNHLLQAGAHGIHDLPCATKLRSWMGREG